MPTVTLTQPPVFIQQGEYSARLTRLFLDLVATEGVVAAGDFEVTERAAAPAMQVDVAAGRAFITGDDISNQFRYVALSEGVVEVSVEAADVTNDRIDLCVVRVLDSDAGVVGDEARIDVITGTPDPSPTVPATPNTALPLASIYVTANAATITDADITDLRVTATSPFPSTVESLGDTNITSVSAGDTLVYSGGTWVNQQPDVSVGLVIALGG